MQQIAVVVVVYGQIAFVDVQHTGQRIQILNQIRKLVVADSIAVSPAYSLHLSELFAHCDVSYGIIKLFAHNEIQHTRILQRLFRQRRDVRTDESDFHRWLVLLDEFGDLNITGKRRCAGIKNRQLEILADARHIFETQIIGWRIDKPAVFNQRSSLRQPIRIPERSDLSTGLITSARAPIKPMKRWWIEKQGLHSALLPVRAVFQTGFDWLRNRGIMRITRH